MPPAREEQVGQGAEGSPQQGWTPPSLGRLPLPAPGKRLPSWRCPCPGQPPTPPACRGDRWGLSEAGRSAWGSGPIPALLEGGEGPSRPADGGPGGGLPGQTG